MRWTTSTWFAAIAEGTEVCEEPQLDWKTVASSDHVGSTWFMRRHGARMVHLQHLREHRVYEELDLPQGIKPLSVRWVDKDDDSTAKARLTARGYEQELTGSRRTSTVRHRGQLRCVFCWRWHSRWGWPWQSGVALKPSSKHPSSRRAMYGSHLRLKLDERGVC